MVELLLQHRANANLQNDNGKTALMHAAFHGHEACVRVLLRAGANTELRDKDGRTAVHVAEQQGRTAIASAEDEETKEPAATPKANQGKKKAGGEPPSTCVAAGTLPDEDIFFASRAGELRPAFSFSRASPRPCRASVL